MTDSSDLILDLHITISQFPTLLYSTPFSIAKSAMANTDIPTRRAGPPSVIHAGLWRTGTASMCEAYSILGLRPWHGLYLDREDKEIFHRFEKAIDATLPHAPGAKAQPPFTRSDWDTIFGEYDVPTDWAGWFVEELANAYPEAKVVIVQRDFDAWYRSLDETLLRHVFRFPDTQLGTIVSALTGNRARQCIEKLILGRFGLQSYRQINKDVARRFYFSYYDRIRQVIPQERKLEYELGSGWKPLCEFLGKEVPAGVVFPRINEAEGFEVKVKKVSNDLSWAAWEKVQPWILGGVVVAAATMVVCHWR